MHLNNNLKKKNKLIFAELDCIYILLYKENEKKKHFENIFKKKYKKMEKSE